MGQCGSLCAECVSVCLLSQSQGNSGQANIPQQDEEGLHLTLPASLDFPDSPEPILPAGRSELRLLLLPCLS